MPIQIEWTEGDIDISVEYDAQDRITLIMVTMPFDALVTLYRFDGTQMWSDIITAGYHEYPIPPGQLKRNEDLTRIRVEPI